MSFLAINLLFYLIYKIVSNNSDLINDVIPLIQFCAKHCLYDGDSCILIERKRMVLVEWFPYINYLDEQFNKANQLLN